jgi:RNA polymerase sigma-70 factor (ECF subfamily)
MDFAQLFCTMRLRLLPMRFSADDSGDPRGRGNALSGGAPQAGQSPAKAAKSAQESADSAQPSTENGVREDMATLVIDNPGLNSAIHSGRGSGLGRENARSTGPRSSGVDSTVPGGDRAAAGAGQTDAEVMLAVAAGDEAGYNYLVTKYHRQIIHFLYRMVHNEAVAEELSQEVFLRVYRSRESYRAEAKFSTWLYRIATNLAVNHARDTKYERTAQTLELDAPDAESGTMPEVADDDPNIEQRMLREERMAAIRAQVAALPERQRMAVLMHKYQEMDYRQIGEVLKLSESATKSLLFRAYQTLRERLKDFV